jgi:small subunit ribosomal protein S4
MANPHEPVCRLCRREGVKLFLKGQKCLTKCTLERRNAVPPGQHSLTRRRKVSDYGLQLRAKQRARRLYGVMEKQFRRYVEKAERSPGVTGVVLLQQLETRLDNVVYRLGFAASRREARQLVGHRHFTVNQRVVNIPSFQVRPGDVIAVREKSRTIQPIVQAQELTQGRGVPDWLRLDPEKLTGTVLRLPERSDMDAFIDEQLIVEYYSR